MVAITVILAAVIGSFVLGLGNSLQITAPNANFDFDFEGSGPYNVTATHQGGDTIPAEDTLELVNTGNSSSDSAGDNAFSAGDSLSIDVPADSTVRVVWTSANGENSQTLAEEETP